MKKTLLLIGLRIILIILIIFTGVEVIIRFILFPIEWILLGTTLWTENFFLEKIMHKITQKI